MWYQKEITISANTTEANAAETKLHVVRGVIHNVWVHFPAGCAGLARVQILEGLHQIAPTNTGQSFKGDGTDINYREHYELTNFPSWITIKTWNTDDTYDHTIVVGLGILKKEVLLPAFSREGILYALKSLFTKR